MSHEERLSAPGRQAQHGGRRGHGDHVSLMASGISESEEQGFQHPPACSVRPAGTRRPPGTARLPAARAPVNAAPTAAGHGPKPPRSPRVRAQAARPAPRSAQRPAGRTGVRTRNAGLPLPHGAPCPLLCGGGRPSGRRAGSSARPSSAERPPRHALPKASGPGAVRRPGAGPGRAEPGPRGRPGDSGGLGCPLSALPGGPAPAPPPRSRARPPGAQLRPRPGSKTRQKPGRLPPAAAPRSAAHRGDPAPLTFALIGDSSPSMSAEASCPPARAAGCSSCARPLPAPRRLRAARSDAGPRCRGSARLGLPARVRRALHHPPRALCVPRSLDTRRLGRRGRICAERRGSGPARRRQEAGRAGRAGGPRARSLIPPAGPGARGGGGYRRPHRAGRSRFACGERGQAPRRPVPGGARAEWRRRHSRSAGCAPSVSRGARTAEHAPRGTLQKAGGPRTPRSREKQTMKETTTKQTGAEASGS